MSRWAMGLLMALVLIPFHAHAGTKSILRFEKKEKPVAVENAREGETPPGEPPASPPAQHTTPGDPTTRSDWYGEKFPKESAPETGEGPRDLTEQGLPGTPADEDERTPIPRPSGRVRTTPAAPPPELPLAAPSPRPTTAAKPVVIPATPAPRIPSRPLPYTYAPVPPDVVTPNGVAPSVTPRTSDRIPAPAPVLSGQGPARPRALPRLAPYGTALPLDRTAPPAAAPR